MIRAIQRTVGTMNKIHHLFLIPLTLIALTACFGEKEDNPKTSSSAHVDVNKEGITLDAKYDNRLDNLIPGYKIVTVAVTNNGVDIMKLNPLKDRWDVTDAYGKPRRAINSLRISNPQAWSSLPEKVKSLIEYPVGVSVGYTETMDLFFPNSLDLTAFRSISFYNGTNDKKYDVVANLESPNAVPISKESDAPPLKPITTKQAKGGNWKTR